MDPADVEPLPAPGTIEVRTPPKLAGRARVPEKEPGHVATEVEYQRLVITHDGTLPAFSEGDVLGGTASGGFVRRVTAVRRIGDRQVALDTVPAALTELLSEGELHIHYDAAEYAERLEQYVTARRALGEEDGEDLASTAESLKSQAGKSLSLLRLAGAELPVSCGLSATGDSVIDVSATLTPVIDLDLEIGMKSKWNPAPEVKRYSLVASGRLDVTAKLHGEGTLSGDCSVDLVALAGGAASVPLPPLTFWVGPVPVIVTADVVPIARADVGLSLQTAEMNAEATTSARLTAGVTYEDKHWGTIWNPGGEGSGTVTLESPGDIRASCKVTAGAEVRARLYGILGPNVGVEAFARAQAVTAPPYCTYDGFIDGGARAHASASVGVSVGPFDLTLAEMPLVNLDLVRFDGPEFSGRLRDAPECDGE